MHERKKGANTIMTVTSFQCDSCGGNIPLRELTNVTVCPYCKKNFFVSADWEESIKVATQQAEQVLATSIRDIKIPEVTERIIRKDIDIFRKINEGIAFLEEIEENLNSVLQGNMKKRQDIENKIGFDYDELVQKTPAVTILNGKNFKYLAIAAYIVCFLVSLPLITLFIDLMSGTDVIFFSLIWPLAPLVLNSFLDGYDNSITIGPAIMIIPYIVMVLVLICVPAFQYSKKRAYEKNLDNLKKDLDLMRIEKRQHLLKENVCLSLDIKLLQNTISELQKLASTASVLKSTEQFNGLSAINIVKKIDYASRRMQAAPIEFELACTNYTPDKASVVLPFGDCMKDVASVIAQKVLDHINR